MKRKLSGLLMLGAVVMASLPASLHGENLESLKQQVDALNARIEQMEARQASAVYQSEIEALRKEIAANGGAAVKMPGWLDNLKIYGDLRLRFQHDTSSTFADVVDKDYNKARNRARFRARVGVTKTFLEKQMEVGIRLATGSGDDNDSTNQTFDNNFSKKNVWVDLAYAKYMPKAIKGLSVIGGKMKNPIRTATWVSWDSDINPEGFAVDYELAAMGSITPYVQAGYFIMEDSSRGHDSEMFMAGAGLNWNIADNHKAFFGATYYSFDNYNAATVGNNGYTGDWNDSDGNPAANMGLVEFTANYKTKVAKLPLKVQGSWVHNFQDDYSVNNPGTNLPQIEGSDNAYLIGLQLGENKKKGDWSVGYDYAWIEANSLPALATKGGLTDSDFGGPNRRGHVISAKYNLDDFLTLGGKVFIVREIETYAGENGNGVTAQVDLEWKF